MHDRRHRAEKAALRPAGGEILLLAKRRNEPVLRVVHRTTGACRFPLCRNATSPCPISRLLYAGADFSLCATDVTTNQSLRTRLRYGWHYFGWPFFGQHRNGHLCSKQKSSIPKGPF